MNLDYNLKEDSERLDLVRGICGRRHAEFSNYELERMADYLLRTREGGTTSREHSREYPVTTHNRNVTHAARNVSLDGMGDAVEFFVGDVAPSKTLTPVLDPITEEDVVRVPGLAANRVVEAQLRDAVANATGHRRKKLKSQLIEVWREAYFLRSLYRGTDPSRTSARTVRDVAHLRLDGDVVLDEDGYPMDLSPVSAMEPTHVSYLLQWYAALRRETWFDLDSDMKWFLIDFAALVRRTFPPHTVLHDLAALRAAGYQLKDIPGMMSRLHGIDKSTSQWNYVLTHTVSNAIAKRAQREWLVWYYSNVEYGEWKRCGRCGIWKPAHPMFWTRDGNKFYSICKECRKTQQNGVGDVQLAKRGGR